VWWGGVYRNRPGSTYGCLIVATKQDAVIIALIAVKEWRVLVLRFSLSRPSTPGIMLGRPQALHFLRPLQDTGLLQEPVASALLGGHLALTRQLAETNRTVPGQLACLSGGEPLGRVEVFGHLYFSALASLYQVFADIRIQIAEFQPTSLNGFPQHTFLPRPCIPLHSLLEYPINYVSSIKTS
jgi:hypothetical protein